MHPTRTTTSLVLGVAAAVSAVSGCVNVTPDAAPLQPAAAPSAGGQPRHETRGGTGTAPVVVQAPALEALKAAPEGSGGGAGPAAEPPDRVAGEGPETAPEGSAEPVPPVPDIPEPRASGDGPGNGTPGRDGKGRKGGRDSGRDGGRGPRAREVEREVMRHLPVRPADVCALGREHGHLKPDSPEARICAGVHSG
ncbi:hypothetical protein [Streptomyces sp. NPDC048603]|uniref:hypothetical protein n=1 Tax=Streptomyces sp. NPDC048603 TaxID=3365577 RepID=UPI0037246A4A